MARDESGHQLAELEERETGFKLPQVLSVLALRGTVVYPGIIVPLQIDRERSVRVIDDVVLSDKLLALVVQRDLQVEVPAPEDLYAVGTASVVLRMVKLPGGGLNILVQGVSRVGLGAFVQTEPYLKAEVLPLDEEGATDIEVEALHESVKNLFQKMMELIPQIPQEMGVLIYNTQDPGHLADLVASVLNLSLVEKQEILETLNVKERLRKLHAYMIKEMQVLELSKKIQSEVKSGFDEKQREMYLREQLRAIQKELGEGDERSAEVEEWKQKIEAAQMPPHARAEADRELDRLSRMHPSAAEYTVARTYLEWLAELPWSRSSKDQLDLEKAQKILDEDHYDLEKVKKRIIEFLAVRKLKPEGKSPILCFAGPPGTGKTSLGKSIARAMGRRFHRISLGGVRDEAEIRGHRRTYVGALPGRIVLGIRKAGTNNPVFMLDEVDKIGLDFRGDPTSALLEVLDPEQNNTFADHYLGVDFDLSKVLFIVTANILDTVPGPLRDRLEILDLPGYTDEEKLDIAKRFLVTRQLEAHGITPRELAFEDGTIRKIIKFYTREAGLRNLEREIATVCRGVAKDVAAGKKQKRTIGEEHLPDFLGPDRFFSEVAERTSIPGVATGMAWTPVGGDLIFVEATKMRGNKGLIMTGQLGDVMRESAQAALSYVRANTAQLEVPENFFEENDIHIHVPAGAIPKDGPSAGITIFTALLSLLKGRVIRSDAAMTGEITLRGIVLPVGGIKQKVLAAHRAGIKTIILPKKNEKDLVDVPPPIRKELAFHLIQKVDEIPPLVFENGSGKAASKKGKSSPGAERKKPGAEARGRR